MKKTDRLLTHFKPEHYDLTFNLQRITRKFKGKVIISGTRSHKDAPIKLHAKDLEIQKVLVNDVPADIVSSLGDEITIIPSSEPVQLGLTLTLEFSGNITDSMHGIYPCYYTHEGVAKEVVATQFESHHAREAFPCIDEPAAKATFTLTLETEKEVMSLSNMPIEKQSTHNDRQVVRFKTTPHMSTYLLAFVSGELHSISRKTKEGVEVSIWATRSQKKEDLMFSLDIAARSIEFFNDYFKTPYPLPKADHVALPDFGGGAAAAMENWGLITYREDYLIANKNTSLSTKQHICSTITHEVSHQWFGNLVTMQWWDDLWLNESFANMMQYIATDALFPSWEIWTDFSGHESLIALRRDCLPGVQSVKQEVHHPDEINTMFDPAIVYAKGGQLLNMVRHLVGEAAFKQGLAHYFKKFAYQNTKGDDLWQALAEASKKDVQSFIKNWLEKPGYPVVKATLEGSTLSLSQEQFLINKKPTKQLWDIPLFSSDHSLPQTLHTYSLTSKIKKIPLKLNMGDMAYFITEYDQTLLSKLIESLDQFSKIDRLQLLNETSLLTRGLRQPSHVLIDLLLAYKNEISQPVWDSIALVISDLKRLVEDDDQSEFYFKYFIQQLTLPLYKKLGWEVKKNENEATAKLRVIIIGLIIYSEYEEAISKALSVYESTSDIADLNGDLRTVILATAVKHSRRKSEVIDELLEYHDQTNSSDLQGDICAALTSTKDRTAIKKFLNLALHNTIRKQDFPHWFIYLIRNHYGRSITWQWLTEHWDWIVASYGSDKGYDVFPRYAASAMSTQKELEEYKAFFLPMSSDIGLKRAVDVGINEINGRVVWIEKNQISVQQKIHKYYSTHSPKK